MTGLVGWWPLHEQSGRANDLSGQGNHGTRNGTTPGVAGVGGLTATSFNGSNDHVSYSNMSVGGQATMSLWIRPDDTSSSWFWTKFDSGADERNWIWRASGGDYEYTFYSDPSSVNATTGSNLSSIVPGEWAHLVVTLDASSNRCIGYRDGVQVDIDTTAFTGTNTSTTTTIGCRSDNISDFFAGEIADVRVYNRALSPAEIQTLYEWGSGDYARPPSSADGGISWYNFNSANANDAWGSNDGTLNGGPTYVADGGPRGDGAYSFDGTDDYIDLGNLGVGSGSLTISAWVNLDASGRSSTLVGRYDGSTDVVQIYDNGIGVWEWRVGHAGGNEARLQVATERVGIWDHLVGTVNISTGAVRFYQNANLVGSYDGTIADFSDTNPIYIGDRGGTAGSNPVAGDIDDVRIYDRALEPWEVFELYQWGTRGRDMRKMTVNA